MTDYNTLMQAGFTGDLEKYRKNKETENNKIFTSSIIKAIKKNEERSLEKKWDKTFWCIDIHDTFIKSNYKSGEIPTEFYKDSIEVLQYLSKRNDICLILYTCSWPNEIQQYLDLFESKEIKFKYVNENPEVLSTGYGCYDKKMYFNILMDDKAGFDPYTDWKEIMEYFNIA